MIIDIQYIFLILSAIAVVLLVVIAYQISDMSRKFSRMSNLTLDEIEKTNNQISRLEVWLERISLDMEYLATGGLPHKKWSFLMFGFEPMEDGRMSKKRHKPETLCQKYILYSYFNNINVINFITTGAPFAYKATNILV